jgi:hypothetical protein
MIMLAYCAQLNGTHHNALEGVRAHLWVHLY